MPVAGSSMLTNRRHILNEEPLRRNPHNTRLCIDGVDDNEVRGLQEPSPAFFQGCISPVNSA